MTPLMGWNVFPPGWRWIEEEQGIIFVPSLEEEDRTTPGDIRTMREVVRMANSINTMIQMTGDCPSMHESGKMPLLDTQVWVEGETVEYEHYRKPMANPLMMLEVSAMPENMKRTVLTQEVVRILRNTRPNLPWETKAKHLNQFSERMKLSGYNELYRYQVIQSGVKGFEKIRI